MTWGGRRTRCRRVAGLFLPTARRLLPISQAMPGFLARRPTRPRGGDSGFIRAIKQIQHTIIITQPRTFRTIHQHQETRAIGGGDVLIGNQQRLRRIMLTARQAVRQPGRIGRQPKRRIQGAGAFRITAQDQGAATRIQHAAQQLRQGFL